MARVEKEAGLESRLDQVKGEMVREVRKRTRPSRPWLSCFLVFLFLIVGFGLWVAWMVAGTGLVRVPVFTALAYESPNPFRPVTPGVPAEVIWDEAFTSTLTRRLYESGGELGNRTFEVQLSEGSLTSSFRSFMEESGSTWIRGSGAQIAVEPDVGIELFVPLDESVGLGTTGVVATFHLDTVDGGFVVDPTSVVVGSTRIPNFMVALFLSPFLESELSKLNAAMLGYARVTQIDILPRELSVSAEFTVELK